MTYVDVEFPDSFDYGFSSRVAFPATIVEVENGMHTRVSRWSAPRREYELSFAIKKMSDVSTLLKFFHARRGPRDSFKFKDFFDFTTAADHISAPTAVDQVIGVGIGGAGQSFDLLKHYAGVTRKLTKIVTGSVKVAANTVDKTANVTVNYLDGTITFASYQPLPGEIISAGCEFRTHVRFRDEDISEIIDAYDTKRVQGLSLIEMADDVDDYEPMNFGRGARVAFNKTYEVTPASPRALWFLPVSASAKVILPNPTDLPRGGPYFFFKMTGTTISIVQRPVLNTTIYTMDPTKELTLYIVETASGNNGWRIASQ